ncbi:hypothetical protein [Mycobacterium paraterrae]|uniref:Uncharacterized protein n=1 Tax=Mycobacterium paraterrae TaxID=577492 RepID=A0ABY5U6W2_9MYCO|nr:hypothetical protein [Mycobacterium paraterrae]UWI82304.1 hypothetical protein MKK62_26425 [Mycobacterium paraterrae]
MHSRDCEQHRAAVIGRAIPANTAERRQEYERGYADGMAERRAG